MTILVIKGHLSRGKEVIELLEMLGGVNKLNLKSTFQGFYYWISENNEIIASDIPPSNSIVYPLEDFEDEFPYKVGDKVIYYPNKIGIIKSMFITYDGDIKYSIYGITDKFFQTYDLKIYKEEEVNNIKEINQQIYESVKINWEQVRVNAAIAAMQALCNNCHENVIREIQHQNDSERSSVISYLSVKLADSLINELKK